ncbi:hypothetical protein MBLNU459_g0918t1 [Dothideomycetes sp. NU459]
MDVWKGSLVLDNGSAVSDIRLSAPSAGPRILSLPPTLRFLAYVDAAKIPLHLLYGPKVDVWTATPETESWFSTVLLGGLASGHEAESADWWHTARLQPSIAVLASVDDTDAAQWPPRPTEILFYAEPSTSGPPTPPTPPSSSQGHETPFEPSFSLHALVLSSHLASPQIEDATPPSSPLPASGVISATFLPPPPSPEPNPPVQPQTAKRKSLSDTFAEAEACRKRVKKEGGAGISAAAASLRSMPTLKELNAAAVTKKALPDTTLSRPHSAGGAVPLQTRPLSRSPSIASARSLGRREGQTEKPRSQLARVTSIAPAAGGASSNELVAADPDLETKNKDTLSRLVMAGMRLHGLSQSRTALSRRKSLAPPTSHTDTTRAPPPPGSQHAAAPKPTADAGDAAGAAGGGDDDDDEKVKDEEYKLIYHAALRGASFSLRSHMARTNLQPHMDVLRETVDKLLALFCADPLAAAGPHGGGGGGGAAAEDDGVTASGRKAFGCAAGAGDASPFAAAGPGSRRAAGDSSSWKEEGGAKVITPGLRRKGAGR